ncbi:MAG: hypothetical protein JXA67_17975 [Micromonosporaceae bacterium]|nr:hypothetical protein [Micromonosporaceae bacterium]
MGFGVVVTALVTYLCVVGLDRADQFGSAAGCVLALVALLAPYLLPPAQAAPRGQDVCEPDEIRTSDTAASNDVRGAQGVQINYGGSGTQTNWFA